MNQHLVKKLMSNSKSSKLVDWDAYGTWNLVLPPNRPDRRQINILTRLLATRKPETICILGSTPEYRQCASMTSALVTIVDKSLEFSLGMDKLCRPNARETKVVSDWIDHLQENERKYDIVLSHFTHGNIHYSRRAEFFKWIRRSLKHEGIFFDVWFNPVGDGYSVHDIGYKFAGEPINIRTANNFNCIALFQSDQIASIGHIDTTSIYEYLERELVFPGASELVSLTKLVTPPGNHWYYHPEIFPRDFGYYDHYTLIKEIRELKQSAFFDASKISILRRAE